jgi:hypothetical protein
MRELHTEGTHSLLAAVLLDVVDAERVERAGLPGVHLWRTPTQHEVGLLRPLGCHTVGSAWEPWSDLALDVAHAHAVPEVEGLLDALAEGVLLPVGLHTSSENQAQDKGMRVLL